MIHPKLTSDLLVVLTKARPRRGFATKQPPSVIDVLESLAASLRVLEHDADEGPRRRAYQTAATMLEAQGKRARGELSALAGFEVQPVLPSRGSVDDKYPLRKSK